LGFWRLPVFCRFDGGHPLLEGGLNRLLGLGASIFYFKSIWSSRYYLDQLGLQKGNGKIRTPSNLIGAARLYFAVSMGAFSIWP